MNERFVRTGRLSRAFQRAPREPASRLKPQASLGFIKLLEFNMTDMSAEALILRYHEEFDDRGVATARQRLKEYGVTINSAREDDGPPPPVRE
jgi:hypothetical protein